VLKYIRQIVSKLQRFTIFLFFLKPEIALGVFSSAVFSAKTVFKVVILQRGMQKGVTVTQQNFYPSFMREFIFNYYTFIV